MADLNKLRQFDNEINSLDQEEELNGAKACGVYGISVLYVLKVDCFQKFTLDIHLPKYNDVVWCFHICVRVVKLVVKFHCLVCTTWGGGSFG